MTKYPKIYQKASRLSNPFSDGTEPRTSITIIWTQYQNGGLEHAKKVAAITSSDYISMSQTWELSFVLGTLASCFSSSLTVVIFSAGSSSEDSVSFFSSDSNSFAAYNRNVSIPVVFYFCLYSMCIEFKKNKNKKFITFQSFLEYIEGKLRTLLNGKYKICLV